MIAGQHACETDELLMANYNKYDPRLEALVMETTTFWDSEIGDITDEDQVWLAKAVHKHPEHASQIHYERSHTGFTREVTVTVADIERIYAEKFAN